MKWFKHDANAILDSKLKKLKLKYGMEGYGLYWYCLECIARNVEAHNLSFELEEDAELISADTGIHYERVEEMMRYMINLKLFDQSNGIITCLKLASRTDEYTQKLLRDNKDLRVSRECPDSVPIKSLLIEENRIEENRREDKRIEDIKPSCASNSDARSEGAFKADVFLSQFCSNKKLISDWLKVRRAKKSANTETAMNLFVSQVKKSGMSFDSVLTVCCERSWAGFRAEWAKELPQQTTSIDKRQLL